MTRAKGMEGDLTIGEKADLRKYLRIFGAIPAPLEDRKDIVSSRFQAALFARDWTKAEKS